MHRYLISINKKRTGRANPECNLRHPETPQPPEQPPPKAQHTADGAKHSHLRHKLHHRARRHDWNSLLTSQEANGTDFPFTSYSDDYFPDASVYRTKKTCILDSTFTQSKRKLNGHSATI